MAFSSAARFIHFPTSASPPNSSRPLPSMYPSFLLANSKNYNAASLHTRNYPLPPSSAKRRTSLCVKCSGAKSSGEGDGNENEPLETARKLYEGIKNKNITQLSEVIGDECPSVYNFFPFFHIFRAKLQVLEFFSHLIKNLGDNTVLMVRPTTGDGTMVGVKWRLGWSKSLMPMGKGFSIHSDHGFGGKLLIRNVESIIEPLLQLKGKPMRLFDLNWVPKQKSRRAASLCLGFFLLVLSLFFFQFSVR